MLAVAAMYVSSKGKSDEAKPNAEGSSRSKRKRKREAKPEAMPSVLTKKAKVNDGTPSPPSLMDGCTGRLP